MKFRDYFKRWRNGEDVEGEFSIDFGSPKFLLLVLIIILIVAWLIK